MDIQRQILDNKVNKVSLFSARSKEMFNIEFTEGDWSENKNHENKLDHIYITNGKALITETSKETASGTLYIIKIKLKAPANLHKNTIISRFKKLKMIQLSLCNGKKIEIARNDVYQNQYIIGKFITNDKFTSIEYRFTQIFPIKFLS